MHFDCRFSDPQVSGNLFVHLAGDDMLKHFPLPRCERVEARADFGKLGLFPADKSVCFNSGANHCEEIFVLHGFGEEIKRAVFHRLHTLRNITVTGEKNNRQTTAFLAQCRLELKAIEVRHRDIKHETSGRGWIVLRKKFPGGSKNGHGNASRPQQTRHSFSYRFIVVHDKYGGDSGRRH